MSIIHISFSEKNEKCLSTLLEKNDKICILLDSMLDGELYSESIESFDAVRQNYWKNVHQELSTIWIDKKGNVENIMEVSSILSNDPDVEIIIWMAGNATDVLGYFFCLHFLRKHFEKISVINIAGLPFLDENFKLYFPNNIYELSVSQISKALKLKRSVTPSEMEVDGEEWKIIRKENGSFRILEGNKKIKSVGNHHFDKLILDTHKDGVKTSKTIQQLVQKHHIEISAESIELRLKKLLSENNM